MLNEYLEAVSGTVHSEGGSVCQVQGVVTDAICSCHVFNAHLKHAHNAAITDPLNLK